MSLPGGAADKVGNRYERRWSVYSLLDVLTGRAASIRIEVPGPAGHGFEFRVIDGAGALWVQAKQGGPTWTLKQLSREGILDDFLSKLQDGDRCRFVATGHASELDALSRRAREAESWSEYDTVFLAAAEHRGKFMYLEQQWQVTGEDLYDVLQRVHVHAIDEESLRRWIQDRIEALFDGDSKTIADVLAQLADDSLHQELTAAEIGAHLGSRDLPPRDLSTYADSAGLLEEQSHSFLAQEERTQILGRALPRAEATKVIQQLDAGSHVLVSGAAGQGKTAVLAQVVREARSKGWPILTIRADRLPAGETPSALGQAMGLPASPPDLLAALAGRDTALLVIDQLDAVSIASGRHTARFDVIADVVARAESHPGLRVVIACRQFDLDNDARLRTLSSSDRTAVVTVEDLPEETVAAVLAEVGVVFDALQPGLRGLLRTPLHLSIYAQLAQAQQSDLDTVANLTDLYDRYWEHKRQDCRERRQGSDQWIEVVDRVCDVGSQRQELSIPSVLLDELDQQAASMASEAVLNRYNGRTGFFHETFFDYCFARRFLTRGHTLEQLLLTSAEQELFRRSQVRQILAYERDHDTTRYLSDLRWLLTDSRVRMHLVAVVLGGFQSLADPTAEEWAILETVATDPSHRGSERAWIVLRTNAAWFSLADQTGFWQRSLNTPEVVDRTVRTMTGTVAAQPDRVVELLRPYLGRSADCNTRVGALLNLGDLSHARAAVDLLIELIPHLPDQSLAHALHRLKQAQPGWVIEIAAAILASAVQTADPTQGYSPFDPPPQSFGHNELGLQALDEAGHTAPRPYVDHILPVLLHTMQRYQRTGTHSSAVSDSVWGSHMWGLDSDLADVLLRRMATALQALTVEDVATATDVFTRLAARPFETAHFLLAKGYGAAPGVFADTAVDWLIATPDALQLGYSTSPSWVSRELIAAASQQCTDERYAAIVERLMYYTTAWERRPDMLKRRGYTEQCLLNGLAPARRPEVVHRRLEELRRKFGTDDCTPPTPSIVVGFVGSPIPSAAALHMTDAQWLSAIDRYRTDDERDGQFTGGAYQLAGTLEEQTKSDPHRFARLALHVPTGANPAYLAAILRGLGAAPLDPDTVLKLSHIVRDHPDGDLNLWLLRLIESNAGQPLHEEVLTLVCLIAATRDDPVVNSGDDEFAASDRSNIETAGLASVRGTAARTLAELLRRDPTLRVRLESAFESLATDRVPAVRIEAIRALAALWPLDQELALRLFNRTLVNATGPMFASNAVWTFLLTAFADAFDQLMPTLERMLNSEDQAATAAAIRLITLASYQRPELDSRIDDFLADKPFARAAAVEVFAAYIGSSSRRDRSQAVIVNAFDDENAAVRNLAARAFYGLRNVTGSLHEFEDLFTRFAASRALGDSGRAALHILNAATAELPRTALSVCEAIVAHDATQLGGVRTSAAGDAFEITKTVLRVYAQYAHSDLHRRCLNLVDDMVTFAAGGIDDELSSFER